MKRKNMVGENLKKIRADKEFTQEEVALRSGLSQGYINQLESGRRMFTQKSLEQIADALDVSIADFFRKEGTATGVSESNVEYNRTKPPTKKEILALLSGLPPKLKEHYFSLLKLEKVLWKKHQS